MTTNERDAFEADVIESLIGSGSVARDASGNYSCPTVADHWETWQTAWQAARAGSPQEPTIDGYPLWSGIPPAPQYSDDAGGGFGGRVAPSPQPEQTCDHMWVTKGWGPTHCNRCGISSIAQPEQTATQFGVDLASGPDRTVYWSPPAAIYTPGHEETYPLAYIGAVQLARQLGYKFVATDHGMAWIKEQA